MLHGKKPRRKEKELLKSKGFVPENWLVERRTTAITFVNRKSGKLMHMEGRS